MKSTYNKLFTFITSPDEKNIRLFFELCKGMEVAQEILKDYGTFFELFRGCPLSIIEDEKMVSVISRFNSQIRGEYENITIFGSEHFKPNREVMTYSLFIDVKMLDKVPNSFNYFSIFNNIVMEGVDFEKHGNSIKKFIDYFSHDLYSLYLYHCVNVDLLNFESHNDNLENLTLSLCEIEDLETITLFKKIDSLTLHKNNGFKSFPNFLDELPLLENFVFEK